MFSTTKRTSMVEDVEIIEMDETSILQIGDSDQVVPVSLSVALQREKAIFYEDEFDFDEFPMMFSNAIPIMGMDLPIEMNVCNDSSALRVKKLEVPFLAASAIVHIGSTLEICADSRIKNIRHFLREKPPNL